jgi:hypothetical protein
MPQWDFLDFLAQQGRRYPAFHLRMQAEVTELVEENGRIPEPSMPKEQFDEMSTSRSSTKRGKLKTIVLQACRPQHFRSLSLLRRRSIAHDP